MNTVTDLQTVNDSFWQCKLGPVKKDEVVNTFATWKKARERRTGCKQNSLR